MKVALTVIAGPGVGNVVEFSEPRGFIIGRAENADYRLPENDLYVSRRHVYLEVCPPSCRVRDLGSTNPPLLNNQPVVEADLNHGDILELGYTRFQISVMDLALPLPEVHCLKCGRIIDVLPERAVPELCMSCESAQKKAIESAPKVTKGIAHCMFCNADLSDRANSDGRAEELKDIVAYACEKCLHFDDHVRGSSIGDFRLIRKLGEGGMGVVYLAYHVTTGRLLALKIIKELKDDVSMKRFERESRILQSVVHENIVRCMHTGTHSDGAFVVTEFMPDGDVERLAHKMGGKLPKNLAVSIIQQVLNAVGYLHQLQIVHRDIKPQNILIRMSNGNPDKVKIADFGLAKCYSDAGGTRLTKPKTGMGTLMYMPPEQITDAASVRESADIYAIGVTLYYLLTGYYTFDFPTPKDVAEIQQKPGVWNSPQEALAWIMRRNRVKHPFQIILGETPIPLNDRDRSIPTRLAKAVDKAVRKDPKERHRSAAEFQAALQGAF